MAKILLGIIALCVLIFIAFATMCAMIVAGRSDKKTTEQNKNGTNEVFLKKQLCPKCKTGKESYESDKSSFECPYISLFDGKNCIMFVETDDK